MPNAERRDEFPPSPETIIQEAKLHALGLLTRSAISQPEESTRAHIQALIQEEPAEEKTRITAVTAAALYYLGVELGSYNKKEQRTAAAQILVITDPDLVSIGPAIQTAPLQATEPRQAAQSIALLEEAIRTAGKMLTVPGERLSPDEKLALISTTLEWTRQNKNPALKRAWLELVETATQDQAIATHIKCPWAEILVEFGQTEADHGLNKAAIITQMPNVILTTALEQKQTKTGILAPFENERAFSLDLGHRGKRELGIITTALNCLPIGDLRTAQACLKTALRIQAYYWDKQAEIYYTEIKPADFEALNQATAKQWQALEKTLQKKLLTAEMILQLAGIRTAIFDRSKRDTGPFLRSHFPLWNEMINQTSTATIKKACRLAISQTEKSPQTPAMVLDLLGRARPDRLRAGIKTGDPQPAWIFLLASLPERAQNLTQWRELILGLYPGNKRVDLIDDLFKTGHEQWASTLGLSQHPHYQERVKQQWDIAFEASSAQYESVAQDLLDNGAGPENLITFINALRPPEGVKTPRFNHWLQKELLALFTSNLPYTDKHALIQVFWSDLFAKNVYSTQETGDILSTFRGPGEVNLTLEDYYCRQAIAENNPGLIPEAALRLTIQKATALAALSNLIPPEIETYQSQFTQVAESYLKQLVIHHKLRSELTTPAKLGSMLLKMDVRALQALITHETSLALNIPQRSTTQGRLTRQEVDLLYAAVEHSKY